MADENMYHSLLGHKLKVLQVYTLTRQLIKCTEGVCLFTSRWIFVVNFPLSAEAGEPSPNARGQIDIGKNFRYV